MSKKNIKSKFTDNISTRHREKSLDIVKKKRDDQTKRKRVLSEDINVKEMISQLSQFTPYSNEQLEHLIKILGSGQKAEPYFAPSNLYPECAKGPFMFPNDEGIRKLIEMFSNEHYLAGQCLLHITGHGETRTWVFKLVHYGLPQILIRHLHHCKHSNIRAICYWMIANMCTDNAQTRDAFVATPEYFTSFAKQTEWEVIEEMCLAFKTLFDHTPIPQIDIIMPLWCNYFQHVNPADETSMAVKSLNVALLCMIVKGGPAYRLWFVKNQPGIIDRMIENVDFLYFMSQTDETHQLLIEKKVDAKFLGFLHQIDPHIRILGAYGLSNLVATNPNKFYESHILKMITDIITQCDIWKVQRQLYFALTEIALVIDNYDLLMSHNIIYHFYNSLGVDDTNLTINTLKSLRKMLNWNQLLVSNIFEDYDGVSRIESISSRSQNEEILGLIENLIEMYFE